MICITCITSISKSWEQFYLICKLVLRCQGHESKGVPPYFVEWTIKNVAEGRQHCC